MFNDFTLYHEKLVLMQGCHCRMGMSVGVSVPCCFGTQSIGLLIWLDVKTIRDTSLGEQPGAGSSQRLTSTGG